MAFDAHKNFANSTIATPPSPATTGTSIVVQTGDGAKFPAAPFNVTVWPTGVVPTSGNAEIMRVTAIATDTFTVVRAQEGTTAISPTAGFQIGATITAKTMQDIEAALANPRVDTLFIKNQDTGNYIPYQIHGTDLNPDLAGGTAVP